MKRFILILLTCAMLAGCLASCKRMDMYGRPETPVPNDNPTNGEENKNPTPDTVNNDTPNKIITDDMEFVAEIYLVAGKMSFLPNFEIKIDNGLLYICDIPFDEVAYVKNVDVKYESTYQCYNPHMTVEYSEVVSGNENEIEIITLMQRIAKQENCYLIKSSTNNNLADFIAAYYIEGVCYFVSFFEDGTAFRINSAKIDADGK